MCEHSQKQSIKRSAQSHTLARRSHIPAPPQRAAHLHVEYADRGTEYGILFIVSLLYEYSNLEYVDIYVIYRVNQAENGIHVLMAASQEYVNTYSTRRAANPASSAHIDIPVRTRDRVGRNSARPEPRMRLAVRGVPKGALRMHSA